MFIKNYGLDMDMISMIVYKILHNTNKNKSKCFIAAAVVQNYNIHREKCLEV